MQLFCDNKATISIAHNREHHDPTTHVEADHHFIKEKLDGGIINISYVPTSEQLADILTKGLTIYVCDYLINKLGLINI